MTGSKPDATSACRFGTLEAFTHEATLGRRNLLLGLGPSRLLGPEAAASDAYAGEGMTSDLTEPGEADIVARITGDLEAAARPTRKDVALRQLRQSHGAAFQQPVVTD